LDDNSDDDHIIEPRIPLLNSVTRHTIAETIFFLVKDDEEQYRAILVDLMRLVQYDDTIEDGYRFLHIISA
jgi:ubiquitin carboxyl-terminal hydrolase 34